jgi:hypothetical protein
MSEDRETHQIITPIKGHVVLLRSWINGREKQKIDGAMFRSIQTEGEGKEMKPRMNETVISGQQNAAIETVVISVDGNEIDVLNRVLDMRVKDFEFVTGIVDKIVEGDFDPKDENNSEMNITESSEQVAEESPTQDSQ